MSTTVSYPYIGGESIIQSLKDVATIITNARTYQLKNHQTIEREYFNHLAIANSIENLFQEITERQIEYAIVGGIAMLMHLPQRNTEDIDLIIAAQDIAKISNLVILDRQKNFIRAQYQGIIIDFLIADNPIFQIVSQQFITEVVWKSTRIRYANPTGLVILKLYALPSLYRQRKFNKTDQYQIDIAAIMRTFPLDFDLIFQVLSRELIPSDVQELRQIVQELRQDRTSRFQ